MLRSWGIDLPSRTLLAVLGAFFVLLIAKGFYNKFHSEHLRSIRGPTLAAYTQYWRVYDVWTGRAHKNAIALHKKYGKLVRIAPHVVSVSDAAAIPVIYGPNEQFTKVEKAST